MIVSLVVAVLVALVLGYLALAFGLAIEPGSGRN